MNKLLLTLTTFFYFITFSLYAENIDKITISGNKRISNETIKILGGVSNKTEIKKDSLNILLKKLYETNFFEDIKISFENNELKIDVIENPIIENIEVTGIKNKDFIKNILDIMTL